MAKSKTTNDEIMNAVVTFTKSDIDTLRRAENRIADAQSKAEGLAEMIAGQLYIVYKKGLYKIDEYKNMAEWANDRFNIAKGTCSDAINTYARFGDMDKIGKIADDYSQYKFSTLIAMKGLSDEDIEKIGIDPTMSRAKVKELIAGYKAIADTQKEREEIMNDINGQCKKLYKAGATRDEVVGTIEEQVPSFLNKEKVNTVDELALVRSALDKKLMEKGIYKPEDEAGSTVEPDETPDPDNYNEELPDIIFTCAYFDEKDAMQTATEIMEAMQKVRDGKAARIVIL